MTLTQHAFASTPTARLAIWRGGPTAERVHFIRSRFHYDAGNPWRGEKLGKTYGCLYHVTRAGLIPVQYDGCRMIEKPPDGPVYSWNYLRARGY